MGYTLVFLYLLARIEYIGVDFINFELFFFSQLRYDGFEAIASNLAKVVNIISACPPMARLHQVVNLGIQAETEGVVRVKCNLLQAKCQSREHEKWEYREN